MESNLKRKEENLLDLFTDFSIILFKKDSLLYEKKKEEEERKEEAG